MTTDGDKGLSWYVEHRWHGLEARVTGGRAGSFVRLSLCPSVFLSVALFSLRSPLALAVNPLRGLCHFAALIGKRGWCFVKRVLPGDLSVGGGSKDWRPECRGGGF